ncbi:MAG: 3-ketoacyl-ACP reductase [Candidatus Pacebacteria bacterium]|nr:3-ketoacyl-ACP reductase [Candidatus Paceibacterota bacterium]
MKTALITGAGRGIGFGIAEKLAAEGYAIAIMDVLGEEDVQANMQKLEQGGTEVLYCRGDVSNATDRAAVLDAIRSRWGGLNVLVNNAGVAPKQRADILEATEESFERLVRINLQGPYFLTQAVANWMIKQKKADNSYRASIVNISSISATVASPSRGEYCISKAGVSMATRLWAARLGEFDIPVYEIRPGIIKTDMTAAVQEKYDALLGEGLAIQARWGYPEDIGKAVAMLVRRDLGYSTGQVIMVDGGMTLQRL